LNEGVDADSRWALVSGSLQTFGLGKSTFPSDVEINNASLKSVAMSFASLSLARLRIA
jgi:hypothetical protein